MVFRCARFATLVLCAFLISRTAVSAEPVTDFYRGKTVTIVVGIAAGGVYDLTARSFARYLGRYLPGNPAVIVQNMPGANSVIAANYVYNLAPHDGTVFWAGSRTTAYEPLLGNASAKFDVRKLRWMGSAGSEVGVAIAWQTARDQTAADLFREEIIVGAVDPGAENYLYPNALNNLIGTKFRIVTGYSSQEPIFQAMERGEVEGDGNASWSNLPTFHPDWLAENKIRVLLQLGLEKHKDLPHVPLVMEFAKTDEQKQILTVLMGMKKFAYPYFMPPDIPADRADVLEAAFLATMRDKDFLAEVRKMRGDIVYNTGPEIQSFINAAYDLPADIIDKTRRLLAPSQK